MDSEGCESASPVSSREARRSRPKFGADSTESSESNDRRQRTDPRGFNDRARRTGVGMSDDWRTPDWLRALLAPKDAFDPCPNGATDGLTCVWPTDRVVYINPPYSNPGPWVARAAKHQGPVVLLLRDDPSTAWWDYSDGFEVIHIGQRIRFKGATKAPNFASCVWRKFPPGEHRKPPASSEVGSK
jgi:DNA N-6-adenine-methyltransferase (Dam)